MQNPLRKFMTRRADMQFRRRMRRARKILAPSEFSQYPEPTAPGNYNQGLRLSQGQYLFDQDVVEFNPEEGIWDTNWPNLRLFERMHAMDWMDDLVAVNTVQARRLTQNWTLQWIARYGEGRPDIWRDDIAAWRLIRFITNALHIIGGLDGVKQERFFETIGLHINLLDASDKAGDPVLEGFLVLTARFYAALALKNYHDQLDEILAELDTLALHLVEERFIYLDSRRPDQMAQIFSLLVWVDQAVGMTELNIGRHHDHAIDILGASVRSLRLRNRKLLEAHGSGPGDLDTIERALSHAQIQGVNHDARVIGFARVDADQLSLIIDCDSPPRGDGESTAHASTLAIWVHYGEHSVIGAMGSGTGFGLGARLRAQETAAHSALTIDHESSSALLPPNTQLGEAARGGFIRAPAAVSSFLYERKGDVTELGATHAGFLNEYGLLHERRISVERDGKYFAGVDYLHPPASGNDGAIKQVLKKRGEHGLPFQIHFHLGPKIEPTLDLQGQAASFTIPGSRDLWIFRQVGALIEIAESAYYDIGRLRPIPTKVLILHSRLVESTGYISWSFQVTN